VRVDLGLGELRVRWRSAGRRGWWFEDLEKGRILHVPGAGKVAVRQNADEGKIGVGTQYMTTPLSVAKQQKVAECAIATYEGQDYNYLFLSNKVPNDTYYTDPVSIRCAGGWLR
jgi:hypothetical protein